MKPWLFVLIIPMMATAQVQIDVSPRKVGINELVKYSITIEGGNNSARQPTFQPRFNPGPFEFYSKRPSFSQQTSIINGRASSSSTYTYTLRPTTKGKLRLPAQTLIYDGQTYRSEEVVIEVGEENQTFQARRDPLDDFFNRRRRPQQQQQRQYRVFGTAELPKKEFYVGEPILFEANIYMSQGLNIVGYEQTPTLPDFKDFWVEVIDIPNIRAERVRHEDEVMEKITIFRRLLFANRTGELEIGSVSYPLVISTRKDSWFNNGQTVRRQSEPYNIKINPLPEQGKPKDFSGLVGDFKMTYSLDKTSVKMGDTISLTIRVEGSGNFAAINDLAPEIAGDNFEVFDGGLPSTETNTIGIPIAKSWSYALVPKREGTYEIPMPVLSFFNPDSKAYRSTKSESYTVEVLPGQGLAAPISAAKDTPEFVANQNLAFIKLDPLGDISGELKLAHPSVLVKLIGGLLLLDLVVFLALFARTRGMSRKANMRPAFAHKNFKKVVAKLKTDEPDAFYGGLSQAILDYFGDKWERTGQGISLEMIQDRFHRDSLDQAYYEKVAECIEACDLARFTPSSPSSRDDLLEKAKTVVAELEEAMP